MLLYRFETWSLTLSIRLRVFQNRVLRKISGHKRDEITGKWGKLHKKELCSVLTKHFWVIKSRRMRWVWHVAHKRDKRGAYRVLVGRPEGKKPLG
jgi:hypothetical protein